MIRPLEKKDAEQVANLLNNFLPFQPETEQTILSAKGIQLVYEHEQEIVGYIAGIVLHDSYAEMPYYEALLQPLHETAKKEVTYYTTHLVVHPTMRGQGVGNQLVNTYLKAVKQVATFLIVVGWVQSDVNRWTAEKLFVQAGLTPFVYIPRYFEPYNVYCPNCQGTCYCDAHIHIMHL
jgi:predicted N-acetyltransferase YhbS